MHRRSVLMSATALAISGCAAPPQANANNDVDATPVTPTDAAFDTGLYRAVAAQAGNHFISPFSIATAFALVYPGAAGETASEIANVFGFDASPAAQAQQTRALMQALRSENGGSEMNVANAAWVERTMSLRPAYARLIREELDGTIEPVDFIRNQAAALRQINSWAARETRDRIREILTEQDPLRRLVLTNAVYFKGKWAEPFSAGSTQDGDFFTGADARVQARLMRKITSARYFETETFQAADLDYDQGAFALAVFLPRDRVGLAAFERELSGENLNGYMQSLASARAQRLDLTLPKIEMRSDYTLNEHLQSMGMPRAFSDAADFSAITADEALKISAVVHKTFLAIDEEGTEAAAVTAVDMVATSAPMDPPPPPPIVFRADHPFFIVLHHKPTRARLFLGRVATV